MRTVIAAGYQFPFLFLESPQYGAVFLPFLQQTGRNNIYLCRRMVVKQKEPQRQNNSAFPVQKQGGSLVNMSETYFFWISSESCKVFLILFPKEIALYSLWALPEFLGRSASFKQTQ